MAGEASASLADAATESVGVHVGMRMRPMVGHEKGQKPCFSLANNVITCIESNVDEEVLQKKSNHGPWSFDISMDSSQPGSSSFCSNEGCYQKMGRPLVDALLKGYNSCLFCYGQTGTGKTATIMGYPGLGPGLLPMMLGDLCEEADSMRARGCTVSMTIMMLEVYNETIHDLLIDRDLWPSVRIRTAVMPSGISVKGATTRSVETLDECLKILEEGDLRKTVAATLMNPVSSRGHMVFKLTLEKTGGNDGLKLNSEVYFADLAGHESITQTAVVGERLIELKSINSSLMYLQRAIHSLATSSGSPQKKVRRADGQLSKPKVNYSIFRNSELTLLLANGLTGNSRAAVIVTLSPAAKHFETSLSSIEFACEVKGMKMETVANVSVDTDSVIKRLEDEVAELKEQLASGHDGSPIPQSISTAAVAKVNPADTLRATQLSKENQELKDEMELLKQKFEALDMVAKSKALDATDDMANLAEVKTTFVNASKAGGGKISKDACVKLFGSMFPTWPSEDISMFFNASNVDSEGLIDFSEWLDWIYQGNDELTANEFKTF